MIEVKSSVTNAMERVQLEQSEADLESLIQRCAEGNQSALEQLYTATSMHVFAVLRRILRVDALAEEALQETFIKIWNNAGQFDTSRSAAKIWMISIARNHAIDLLRLGRTREEIEMKADRSDVDRLPSHTMSIETSTEIGQHLEYCLQKLAAPARECIVLAYCEGYSLEELSDRLDRTVGTVKSWIRHSLISLKACLDGHN